MRPRCGLRGSCDQGGMTNEAASVARGGRNTADEGAAHGTMISVSAG